MSDRPCNYCEVRSMKRDAEKRGMVVTTRPGDAEVAGTRGVDVFKHRPGVETTKGNWQMWCMELPDHCCC